MKNNLVIACTILALTGGILAGWVDFNNDEVQAAVLVIILVTFFSGLIFPRKAWLWATIVALCLPGVYLFARSLGYHPVSPPSPDWYASIMAIIPALIGAYAGAVARVIYDNAFKPSSPHQGK